MNSVAVADLLAKSLNFREAKEAEAQLRSLELQPGFPLVLLRLVGDYTAPNDVRLASALFFKNLVKTQWTNADGNYLLAESDVQTIKDGIIDLLIAAPPQPRKQLGEGISHIAQSDFPDRWPNLVPILVSKLDINNPEVNNSVLGVAHAIFGRWRSLDRSNALFLEIKLALSQFAEPYLAFVVTADQKIKESANKEWLESMNLLIKIFYDLNCQDLPEFFEDHIKDFMAVLLEYLSFPLQSGGDEDTPGVEEHLKTGVCEALRLYTERYEEEFASYMPQFVEAGWTLLTTIGSKPKYDGVANRCLAFLTSVAHFERNLHMFSNEQTLIQLIECIIIPNMNMRESDLELFEDDPLDYVRQDIEGSDSGTRRNAARGFLRELADKMEQQVTSIVMRYVDQFISEFHTNRSAHWRNKSTAAALFSAIAAKGQITASGVTATNSNLDVVGFFNKNMAPELSVSNNTHPMLKADAIRFIVSFRNQLSKQHLTEVIPPLTSLLSKDQAIAVYTYAAICLERILATRDPTTKRPLFGEQDVGAHVRVMSTHSLKLVSAGSTKPEELAANEFLMKLLMRILVVSGGEVKHVASLLVPQLVQIVQAVSSNPSNPRFNHYLFESLGACLRHPYTDYNVIDTDVVQPFFGILGSDVTEFVPYILQILTEILELQPADTALPPSFQQLLKPVLAPQLWEARGNVPALVSLLEIIVRRGPSLVLEEGLVMPLLGVFQNLLSSSARGQYTFELLECILTSLPLPNVAAYLPQIAKLLCMRLEKSKTDRYAFQLTKFGLHMAAMPQPLGGEFVVQLFDSAKEGMFGDLFTEIMLPMTLQIHGFINRKVSAVGLTNLLCGTPQFVSGQYAAHWQAGITQLVGLLTRHIAEDNKSDAVADFDVSELVFGSSFSPLATTRMPPRDPVAYIGVSAQVYFANAFKKVASSSTVQNMVNGVSPEIKQFLVNCVEH